MEIKNIFKKIYTHDRLPKEGWYNTNKGVEYYSEKLNDWASSMYTSKPEWWLEEIELPSEDELEDRAINLGYKHTSNENGIFRQGSYEIINKIKGA